MKKFFGILKNVTFDLIRIKILILLEYNLVMNINNNKIFSTIQLLYSAQSCIYTYTYMYMYVYSQSVIIMIEEIFSMNNAVISENWIFPFSFHCLN